MRAVIHCNPGIRWQLKYSKAIKKGLDAFSIPAKITGEREQVADLRIILGPHWGISDGLLIDRAFWGDPYAVSVHWLKKGSKVYDWTPKAGRYHPELKPMKDGDRQIVLCDFGKHYNATGTLRRHPAERGESEPLKAALERHDKAIGGKSTALVDAAIEGLKVTTVEKNTPVDPISGKSHPDRLTWVQALSWHNWTFNELEKGELWPHYLK